MADLPQYRQQSIVGQIGVVRVDPRNTSGYSALSRAADEAGALGLKQYAAEVEDQGRKAGLSAGVARDENGNLTFTPPEDTTTVYGKAFMQGALLGYQAEVGLDANKRALDLAQKYQFDPQGFATEWKAVTDGALQGVHADIAPYARMRYDAVGQQHAAGITQATMDRDRALQMEAVGSQLNQFKREYEQLTSAGGAFNPDGTMTAQAMALRDQTRIALERAQTSKFYSPDKANELLADFDRAGQLGAFRYTATKAFESRLAKGDLEGAYKATEDEIGRMMGRFSGQMKPEELHAAAETVLGELRQRTSLIASQRAEHDYQLGQKASSEVFKATLALRDAIKAGDIGRIRALGDEMVEKASKAGTHWQSYMQVDAQARATVQAMAKTAIDNAMSANAQSTGGDLETQAARFRANTVPGSPDAPDRTEYQRAVEALGLSGAEPMLAALDPKARAETEQKIYAQVGQVLADNQKNAARAAKFYDALSKGIPVMDEDARNFGWELLLQDSADPRAASDPRYLTSRIKPIDPNDAGQVANAINTIGMVRKVNDQFSAAAYGHDPALLQHMAGMWDKLTPQARAGVATRDFWDQYALAQIANPGNADPLLLAKTVNEKLRTQPLDDALVTTRLGKPRMIYVMENAQKTAFDVVSASNPPEVLAKLGNVVFSEGGLPAYVTKPSEFQLSADYLKTLDFEFEKQYRMRGYNEPEAAMKAAATNLSNMYSLSRYADYAEENGQRRYTMARTPFEAMHAPSQGGVESIEELAYKTLKADIALGGIWAQGAPDVKDIIARGQFKLVPDGPAGYQFRYRSNGAEQTFWNRDGTPWHFAPTAKNYEKETLAGRQARDAAKPTTGLSWADKLISYGAYGGKRALSQTPLGEKPAQDQPGLIRRQLDAIDRALEERQAQP